MWGPELTVPFLCVCLVHQTFINTLHALGQHMNNLVHTKIRKSILKTTNQSSALALEKGNAPTEVKAIMQTCRTLQFLSFCPPSQWSWGVFFLEPLHSLHAQRCCPSKDLGNAVWAGWRLQPLEPLFHFSSILLVRRAPLKSRRRVRAVRDLKNHLFPTPLSWGETPHPVKWNLHILKLFLSCQATRKMYYLTPLL